MRLGFLTEGASHCLLGRVITFGGRADAGKCETAQRPEKGGCCSV
ncbi:hypothetical protein RBSH_04615 [Rhodopirellula baltica SH28]|uniref:Uncharacterized protein n=1 Tax=Rhodopirellula baltica SH28 TaxID=993517 RepID=K5DCB5_RHOBT|nr:hypothetical protein RBSH_04615 [Rhodopirellula baltica SH28]